MPARPAGPFTGFIPEHPANGEKLPRSTTLAPSVFCLAAIALVGTDLFAIAFNQWDPGLAPRLKLICHLGMLMVCAVYARVMLSAAMSAPALVALVTLAATSVLWSVDPGLTMKRLLPLLACTAVAALIGQALSLRSLILFLGALAVLVAASSMIMIAIWPAARGAPPWDDVWRGVFNHKNGLGAASAILLPFALYAALVSEKAIRGLFAMGALLCLFLLVASASRTAQIIGVLALGNLFLGLCLRRSPLVWAALTVTFLVTGLSVVSVFFATGLNDQIFEAMGRKPTMSGRIPIWQLTMPFIEARAWLGHGYAAFWDPEFAPRHGNRTRSDAPLFTILFA